MADAVGVHGISQQQGGPTQLLRDWKDALVDGLIAARGKSAGLPAPTMDIGYYGNLFLRDWPKDAKGTSAAKRPKGDGGGSGRKSPEDDEWFAEIADELPVEEVPPSKGPLPAQRLAAWLDSRFGAAERALFFGDLRQVRLYQQDDALANKVQARVQEAVGDGCRVLIGHSLGSVVAYETVCAGEVPAPQLLLTLGSPLALRTVRNRLRYADPPEGLRWINVYDPRDVVSCAGGIAPWWPGAEDRTVDNGNQPHAVIHYLGKWKTGSAVADALGR